MPSDPDKPVTLEELRELAEFMRENELTELAIEESKGSRSIRLRRGDVLVQAPPMSMPGQLQAPSGPVVEGEADQIQLELIRSPMVGTFYRSSRPGDAPFVDVGDHVREGDMLCIIEAMKLMNHIEAEFEAEIVEVFIDNATPVEFGEPLYRVRRV